MLSTGARPRIFWNGPCEKIEERKGLLYIGSEGTLVCTRLESHLSLSLCRRIMETCDRTAREHGRFSMFLDWEQASGYDSNARVEGTRWARAHGRVLEGIHILVSNRMVHMGISVASIVLGQLHTYRIRQKFEQEYTSIRNRTR